MKLIFFAVNNFYLTVQLFFCCSSASQSLIDKVVAENRIRRILKKRIRVEQNKRERGRYEWNQSAQYVRNGKERTSTPYMHTMWKCVQWKGIETFFGSWLLKDSRLPLTFQIFDGNNGSEKKRREDRKSKEIIQQIDNSNVKRIKVFLQLVIIRNTKMFCFRKYSLWRRWEQIGKCMWLKWQRVSQQTYTHTFHSACQSFLI